MSELSGTQGALLSHSPRFERDRISKSMDKSKSKSKSTSKSNLFTMCGRSASSTSAEKQARAKIATASCLHQNRFLLIFLFKNTGLKGLTIYAALAALKHATIAIYVVHNCT